MNIEYEAKFLNVDSVTMGEKLLAIGAKPIHARILMKRVLFDHPLVKNAFIRIRDE